MADSISEKVVAQKPSPLPVVGVPAARGFRINPDKKTVLEVGETGALAGLGSIKPKEKVNESPTSLPLPE